MAFLCYKGHPTTNVAEVICITHVSVRHLKENNKQLEINREFINKFIIIIEHDSLAEVFISVGK